MHTFLRILSVVKHVLISFSAYHITTLFFWFSLSVVISSVSSTDTAMNIPIPTEFSSIRDRPNTD
ncbi:hypothetical protein HanRHA438_Chr05g0204841 [Helianthus annuus]|nr:hypothetical protein HanRHA438_Chr05g0204841 [Helianthus annuus]